MKLPLRMAATGLVLLLLFSFKNGTKSETSPKAPVGMAYVQAGTLKTTDKATGQPKEVALRAYFIDKSLVTVADYEAFVKATGYKTEAEKFGNSAVFDFEKQDWLMVEGADFRYPFGPGKAKSLPNHPVTQVSWNDAWAYARWKKKRLPTEAEWEWAARNAGTTNTQYSWGDKLIENGKYKANTWQGNFPYNNTKADGYAATSPAGAFGVNKLGLADMGGNVWQWCQDEVPPTPDEARTDPSPRRVTKGGSFLCDPAVCHGFRVTGRSSSTPETGLVHTGFRCVQSIQ